MSGDKRVRMANQITDFFRAYPEAEAVEQIAEHIRLFWPRKMREDAMALAGEKDLDPLAARALALIANAPAPSLEDAPGIQPPSAAGYGE